MLWTRSLTVGWAERSEAHAERYRWARRFAPLPTLLRQLVKPPRRVAEQHRLFVCRGAGGQALEGVPVGRVGAGNLVDREVALEHAARRAEPRDADLPVAP